MTAEIAINLAISCIRGMQANADRERANLIGPVIYLAIVFLGRHIINQGYASAYHYRVVAFFDKRRPNIFFCIFKRLY